VNLSTLNVLDGLIILIIGWNLIRGFNKGFIEEIISIIGIVASLYLAYIFAPTAAKLMVNRPDQMITIISGVFIFAISFIVSKYVAFHFNRRINETVLGIFNNILGFLFGIVRGWLLASIAVFLIAILTPDGYLIKRSSLGGLAVPVIDKTLKLLPLKNERNDIILKNWFKAEKLLWKNFTFRKYIERGKAPSKLNSHAGHVLYQISKPV